MQPLRQAGCDDRPHGPLAGVRVVEMAGIGPVPFACMMLADMGADVVQIVRPGTPPANASNHVERGRTRLQADLKTAQGSSAVAALARRADVLVEGYRPGVMERLSLGPDALLSLNPRLIYARMTGWGQTGPLAHVAGHDINYIALTGLLDAVRGDDGAPVAPLNVAGDYGGGALYMVIGVLAGLIDRTARGHGEVIDAAMCDGAAHLMSLFHALRSQGQWRRPGTNLIDGGAPFYRVYACADGHYLAVGAIEPQFFTRLCDGLGIPSAERPDQMDRATWPATTRRFATLFAARPRNEWLAVFADTDACVTPVLTLEQSTVDPHLLARRTFAATDGTVRPAPAPRFSAYGDGPLPFSAEQRPRSMEAIIEAWSASPSDDHQQGANL